MAITDLGHGTFPPDGTWQLDWDSATRTIGATVASASPPPTALQIVIEGTVGTYVGDCLNGPASGTPTQNPDGEDAYLLGNILNAGRIVVLGPGSVIGKTAP